MKCQASFGSDSPPSLFINFPLPSLAVCRSYFTVMNTLWQGISNFFLLGDLHHYSILFYFIFLNFLYFILYFLSFYVPTLQGTTLLPGTWYLRNCVPAFQGYHFSYQTIVKDIYLKHSPTCFKFNCSFS